MTTNSNAPSKSRKKIVIIIVIAFLGCISFWGRFYIIALYKTITFKTVKAGDKLYFPDDLESGGGLDIRIYYLGRPKTSKEIDDMKIPTEEKSKLKNQLKDLKGLKTFDTGAAFTVKLVKKHNIFYLGECVDTLSTQNRTNLSEIKLNTKIVEPKFNNPEIIPGNYVLVNNHYYIESYGCCVVVK